MAPVPPLLGRSGLRLLTIDTALLRRYYVLFFIHIPTRHVFFAGMTARPTGAWTAQSARNLFLRHADQLVDSRALVRDRGRGLPPLPSPNPEPDLPRLRIAKTTRCDGLINEYRNAA
ncbi:MAG: hypothetical protein OES13_09435 [Acidimicrobiia bacterium]|nr:hypothetical protein [Acidimicrobiia bacterium]